MSLRATSRFIGHDESTSFNITPIIDVVFLLIIFFLVVCQFIEAENFGVDVPDDCEFAANVPEPGIQVTTVTVMKTDKGGSDFAVGAEKISTLDYGEMVGDIARLVNIRLKDLPSERRVVTLRIDRDVCFADAQYALAGIAASSATDIQLAVLKEKHSGAQ